MTKLALMLLVLTPALAHADKTFSSGRGTTWNCKTDPTVTINHALATYTFKGACKTINLNSGQNTLTIESVDELNVTGGSNTIAVGTVGQINVVGAGNTITWKKAKAGDKPGQSVVGAGNKIQADGGGAADSKPADSKPADSKPAPVPAGAIDCAKSPKHTLDDAGGSAVFVGTCEQITVNGAINQLTIENVKQLVVNGASNTITVGGADTISLVGNDNKLTYKTGLAGAKPKIKNVGTHNTATQSK